MQAISELILPVFLAVIIVFSIKARVPVYDTVISGAEDGMMMLLKIVPSMIAIMTAVAMLRSSGIFDFVVRLLEPVMNKLNVPPEILPMVILRPISGSGAFGILTDNLTTYGADSRIGRLSSVIMGSTETTFYTIAIYFSETNMKNVFRAIPCAVIADLVCVVLACIFVR